MAFKDNAHTTDLATAGLSSNPAGSCKGQYQAVCTEVRTTDGPLDIDRWCAYCRAKHSKKKTGG